MQSQILNYSATTVDDGTFRLDAEHYQAQYLLNQEKLNTFGSIPLLQMIARPVMTGHTPSMKIESYYGGNIGFVKTDNLREFKISGEFTHYLSNSGNDVIKRSALKNGDLIITIIGATHKIVGRAALVRKEDLPANINQNIALVRLKKRYSPEFLSAYLNSTIGRFALWYLSRQTEQVNLNCREVEKVLVPDVTGRFVNVIEGIYKRAVKCEHESRAIFTEAENILLSELGLTNWQPKHQLTFIKNYSDTEQAQRIDAEYYQPKYDDIINAIKNYSGGWDTLDNLVTLKNKNFKPKDKEQYQYIELANIAGNGEITDCMLEEGQDLPTRARRKVTTGDVIVSSIEGSLSSIALIEKEYNLALCSTGFHVVNSKHFNSETLLVLLKSIVGQLQLKKGCSGTILTAINKEEFKSIILPKVAEAKQQAIQQKVTESFNLRKQSKHLLECAKKAVEMAIEQDEQTAIKWLENETREMQI